MLNGQNTEHLSINYSGSELENIDCFFGNFPEMKKLRNEAQKGDVWIEIYLRGYKIDGTRKSVFSSQ